MKIGLIGLGVVGKACKEGFEHCGYNVVAHDIALDTKNRRCIRKKYVCKQVVNGPCICCSLSLFSLYYDKGFTRILLTNNVL